MITAQNPDVFEKREYIYLRHPNKKWWEPIVLGKAHLTGHWNWVSGPRRGLAALWQTALSLIALNIFIKIGVAYGFFKNPYPMENDVFIGTIAIVVSIFGATFINERASLHEKWQYLANTFNLVLGMPPGVRRNHMEACLLHDILTLEMWAHRSFRAVFKDGIEQALRLEHQSVDKWREEMVLTGDGKLTHSRALQIIGNYNTLTDKLAKTETPAV
jgi:hypothetical protein